MESKKTTLADLFSDKSKLVMDSLEKIEGTPGAKGCKFGKITCNYLIYNGRTLLIKHVNTDSVEVDADNLFGRHGDEFPFHLVRF